MANETTETIEPRRRLVAETPTVGLVALFSQSDENLPSPTSLRRACRIGRDEQCDVVIAGDAKVSREHAIVGSTGKAFHLRDLGSRNGTYLNGDRLGNEAIEVHPGTTFRIGNTLLRVVPDIAPYRVLPRGYENVDGLVGGAGLRQLRRTIAELAPSASSLLITGESGAGKERVAEAVHRASGRHGEFVAINCAAIPHELIESELFGHAKGAFSGSDRTRKGLFRSADGGTLLLDEIGDLPLEAQAKLLRVLEQREVRPVGDDRPIHIDVRVLAATHRNLAQCVARGEFRDDLYHRIVADAIAIAPLRERVDDIPGLAQFFLDDEMSLTANVVERLMRYAWPGNVRELRNVVQATSRRAHARGATRLELEHLPESFGVSGPRKGNPLEGGSPNATTSKSMHGDAPGNRDQELRTRLETALRLRKGNVSQVARDLNIRRAGIYEHLKRFKLDPSSFR